MENRNKRKALFWGLAVVYLLYSVYKMFRTLPGIEGRERVVVLAASFIFLGFSVYMVYKIIKLLKEREDSKDYFGKPDHEERKEGKFIKDTEFTEKNVDIDKKK